MCKGGGDGCKQDAVGYGKRHGNEDGAVGLVSLKVEGGIGINDLRDIIVLPCVIKSVCGHQGKVSAVPNVGVLKRPMFRKGKKKNAKVKSNAVSRREWERGTSRRMRH
jgi:hypothetical protein